MANPAPTINQINAFNATQGTTIDFNIIGGTELVRSNRIYIYDLSDNSLICTHLYVSTESIHELPPNTDGSIVYESGKSSADFVNGAQYYAQIQTFTDIAGTEGGSGLSVAKMFWCLVDPTLTITTIPSTISTTSYNVSATYNANTSVVSNIIQQYQFSLYSATGSLLQSSGVIVGSGEQQGTSTTYDISYNFTGLSVGSSYYVTVEVTTTQGMSINTQSNTFTVSIDTPTLGEATVVNNACDGYISVTSNLSGEYGGSGSGEIVSFETDSENVFTKLQVELDPIQDLHGYDKPWVGGAGKNKLDPTLVSVFTATTYGLTTTWNATKGCVTFSGTFTGSSSSTEFRCLNVPNAVRSLDVSGFSSSNNFFKFRWQDGEDVLVIGLQNMVNGSSYNFDVYPIIYSGTAPTSWTPYENICPISGHDEVGVVRTGKNIFDESVLLQASGWTVTNGVYSGYNSALYNKYYPKSNMIPLNCKENTSYTWSMKYRNATSGGETYFVVFYSDGTGESINRDSQTEVQLTLTSNPNKTLVGVGFSYASPSVIYIREMQIEEGTTATTYEPYTAEEIHQDIEATYTPIVQENEPYQFKRTGDVGGDRESIELVGGSVAWNQLVQNGNFSTESNWSASNATKSISSGICTFTATAQNGNICTSNPSRIFPSTVNNHKYFALAEVKLTTATTDVVLRLNGGYREVKTALNTNWQTLATVYNLANSDNGYVQIMDKRTSGWDSVQVKTIMVVDLTQLFGSTIADYIYTLEQGQAGAGVAFFRKYFPKPYYPYDAGTIKSVEGVSAHKTVGFNAWDEEWELGTINWSTGEPNTSTSAFRSKNFIRVVGGSQYFLCAPVGTTSYIRLAYYDANKNFISASTWQLGMANISIPSQCAYMKFVVAQDGYGTSTYNNDICINISWDGERNGEYEPYVEHSYPLDSSITLRGIPKIANGKLYYDGDTYRSDGLHTERFSLVDLGSLNWGYSDTYAFFYTTLQGQSSTYSTPSYMCAKYAYGGWNSNNADMQNATDKTIWKRFGNGLSQPPNAVYVKDSAYTDAATFKTAMSGVYLLYEKATPTTSYAEPFEAIQKVTPNYGTEEFVTDSIVPVGNNTQYYTRDIYGGYIDLVSGVLTVDRTITDLGTLTWSARPTWGGFRSVSIASDVKKPPTTSTLLANCKCSTYNQTTAAAIGMSTLYSYAIDTDGAVLVRMEDGKTASDITGQLVYPLATPQTYQLTPQQIQTLVGVNNVWSEQGDVELSYHIPITNLLVKRQDVDDVSGDWLTLYSQPITQASDMDFTFIDFTNQYGKTYKYALVPLLTQTQSGVEVEVEGGYTVSDEVQSVFDGVFIVDSTGSQKCKANVGYGNVDMNQVVGSITPIGAKYPIVITNSQNQYHNGSISGTIVPDDYYFNGNLSRIDMVNKRNELEQFLTNKRAKIIKDWNGNIWLVMIMDNVSCTFNNNYGMGIVNFNTNWVEVGDPTNQQDLQATGLINVGGV